MAEDEPESQAAHRSEPKEAVRDNLDDSGSEHSADDDDLDIDDEDGEYEPNDYSLAGPYVVIMDYASSSPLEMTLATTNSIHGVEVSIPTVSNTLKKSQDILKEKGDHASQAGAKRQKSAMYPNVEEALLKWVNLYQLKIASQDLKKDRLVQSTDYFSG
ncbi:hypothetical protein BGZ49_001338 [Haplosporangium sp. Z 27]|nr:hypothetical protein BGZ49_001338 [Haplosporangium sp. Z 27]